jgi:hypothetical protein
MEEAGGEVEEDKLKERGEIWRYKEDRRDS